MSTEPVSTRILVVDDDPDMLVAVEAVLAGRHEVRTCPDPTRALDLAREFRPHVAVVDLRMPEMDGFTLLGEIKDALPETQVILMTGSVFDVDRHLIRAVREKAFYFIQKPFDREVLLTLVDRCNEIRILEEEKRRHLGELERQMREARAFQRSILPRAEAAVEGFRIAARHVSCHAVGGDLVDYVRAGRGKVAALVADVAGSGVSAAMLTGLVKAAFHASGADRFEPGSVVRRAAEGISAFEGHRFVTLLAVRLSADTAGSGTLEYANAGHEGGFLWSDAGEVVPLLHSGPMISSVFPDPRWETRSVPWSPGRRLLLYSDGITEARADGEEFGEERLVETVRGSGLTGSELLARILDTVHRFVGRETPWDDLTLFTAGR